MFASNTSAANGAATYIEDVFSTYLYTGTGTSQTQTNNIDLSTKGGLVWLKRRSSVENHYLQDSASSFANSLSSNTTAAAIIGSGVITSVSTTGFTTSGVSSGSTYASWTFRKQPKFFDVVTYTGDGATNRQIAHNLGSTPGCIIVKCTSGATNWVVYHRNLTNANYCLILNSTTAQVSDSTVFGTAPTDTVFTVARTGVSSNTNQNGATYVAYLFAHDAGGFGLTGTDNVISCGSYTGTGAAGLNVTLGYEPQFVLIKRASGGTGNWHLIDTMRGWPNSTTTSYKRLLANTSAAEDDGGAIVAPTATGFTFLDWTADLNASGSNYIYIAIRRGPMKTPTSGTSVFSPNVSTAAVGTDIATGFPVDMQFPIALAPTYTIANAVDRLRGVSSTTTSSGLYLEQSNTNAEASGTVTRNWGNTGFQFPQYFSTLRTLFLNFRRAPGFFDEVCYTGTGSSLTLSHNLGVTPQLLIYKSRSLAGEHWGVWSSLLTAGTYLWLDTQNAANALSNRIVSVSSTQYQVGTNPEINQSGATYVSYLFASCPGVSKVGSYTGTGTTNQINCGFTSGARFVLIKRTDSTGDWYVWDSARGIVAGNDPYLLLNSTAAEVTTTDYVDTYSAGFEISSTAPAAINASGGTFIYLAIA